MELWKNNKLLRVLKIFAGPQWREANWNHSSQLFLRAHSPSVTALAVHSLNAGWLFRALMIASFFSRPENPTGSLHSLYRIKINILHNLRLCMESSSPEASKKWKRKMLTNMVDFCGKSVFITYSFISQSQVKANFLLFLFGWKKELLQDRVEQGKKEILKSYKERKESCTNVSTTGISESVRFLFAV